MNILLIGASGFLGTYVFHSAKTKMNISIAGTSTHGFDDLLPLDITDYDKVVSIVRDSDPNCIINCAAVSDVGECERNPLLARQINSIGPKNLAKISTIRNIKLIHISTDSIFDGKSGSYSEDSCPGPVNVYSEAKLNGEKFIESIATDYIIIRTNFYGFNPRGSGRMNWILENLKKSQKMTGVDDQVFNPIWVTDLASITLDLSSHNYRGILNCTGNEIFSKYEFIRKIAHELGYRNAEINKGISEEVFSDAKRPGNTTLNNDKLRELLNIKIHSLHEVLSGSEFNEYRSNESRKI